MPTGDEKNKQPNAQQVADDITDQNRKDWNAYYKWLQDKKLSGSKDLDQGEGENNKGVQTLQQYIKENPKTSLTPDLVPAIQKDFSNYRQFAMDDIKKGNGVYAPGVNDNNFMQELSVVDGLPGSKTTRHFFPPRYVDAMAQKEGKAKDFAKSGQTVESLYK